MAKEVPLPPDAEFGDWVCARKQAWGDFYVTALALTVLGLLAALSSLHPSPYATLSALVGIAMFFTGIGILIYVIRRGRTVLSFYSTGVIREHKGQTDRMLYAVVIGLTYSIVRHYHNGIYTHTKQLIELVAAPSLKLPAFTVKAVIKENRKGFLVRTFVDDDPVGPLMEHVAKLVGERLYQAVLAGNKAPWTGDIELDRQGLFVGGQFVPLSELQGEVFEDGKLTLSRMGKPLVLKAAVPKNPNFLPGYFAFQRLLTANKLGA